MRRLPFSRRSACRGPRGYAGTANSAQMLQSHVWIQANSLADRAVCTIAGLAVGVGLASLSSSAGERLQRLQRLYEKQATQYHRQLHQLWTCSLPSPDLAETEKLIHRLFWRDQKGIHEAYHFPRVEPLGAGAYGVVLLAKHRKTGIERAVKRIDKQMLQPGEVEALKKMDHPHICRLVEYFETPRHLWLVTELCRGEELCGRLLCSQGLRELEVAQLTEQMLRSTLHCHRKGLLHRDLKPENFLFTGVGSHLKLIDFGFALREDAPHSPDSKYAGTLLYASPQLLQGRTATASDDAWSLGVIFFIMLTGQFPFSTSEDSIFKEMYQRGVLQKDMQGHLANLRCSPEAADLAQRLLAWDVSERISLEASLEHPFLADLHRASPLLPAEDVYCRLGRLADACRFQQIVLMAAAHLLGDECQDGDLARATFMELERMSGRVSMSALQSFLQMHGIHATTPWLSKVGRLLSRDDSISYTSFLAAVLDPSSIRGDHRLKTEVFALLDTDGDGIISEEDLRTSLNLSVEDSGQVLREALSELGAKARGISGISFWQFLHLLEPAVQRDEAQDTLSLWARRWFMPCLPLA